ncbi:F-type H+-transporting ATPase subunit b [Vigna unguiculata]|uniref:F-type H+-transporting ATPase subunit b n=2 Tax=Vigna unguiculata TaxID=3917 RepID=A0A4D6NVF0_VIGUN|nr:F-type H+-transporting ATPase subunit b [Vigna unguiculata]
MNVGEGSIMILSNGSYQRSSSMTNKDDTFYYKPPSETLNLSIIKLDASSFRIEVANEATVAKLKQAVEEIFAHVPLKGAGKILWPLVWRQFCLSYQGHKLLTETDYLRDYGIKDGDQLHFVRHISDTGSYQSKQSKKRDFNLKNKHRRSSHQLNIYQRAELNDDEDDIGLNGIVIEKGNIQKYKAEQIRGGKSWLSSFLGRLFSNSRLPVVRRQGTEALAMANMIMASTKPLVPIYANSRSPTAKLPILQLSLPKVPTLKLKLPVSKPQMLSLLGGIAPLILAQPSLASEIEKAALFDFNLTLPIIMVEFLFLMVALDKIWFTPLGKFMDERDAMIREKLNSVKDTSSEVKQLEEKANAVMAAARAEIAAALNAMKKETQAEVEEKIAEGRKKVEAELQEALANLERQKEETIKSLDSQIADLSEEIVKKVLPVA